jgi:chromosome segregation ATPase
MLSSQIVRSVRVTGIQGMRAFHVGTVLRMPCHGGPSYSEDYYRRKREEAMQDARSLLGSELHEFERNLCEARSLLWLLSNGKQLSSGEHDQLKEQLRRHRDHRREDFQSEMTALAKQLESNQTTLSSAQKKATEAFSDSEKLKTQLAFQTEEITKRSEQISKQIQLLKEMMGSEQALMNRNITPDNFKK